MHILGMLGRYEFGSYYSNAPVEHRVLHVYKSSARNLMVAKGLNNLEKLCQKALVLSKLLQFFDNLFLFHSQ